MSINNKLIVFFTGIIAIATVLYSAFAGWQLYEIHQGAKDTHLLATAADTQATATRQLAESAKLTIEQSDRFFRIQMRPYVVPGTIVSNPAQLQAGANQVSVTIINSGRTPAIDMTFVPSFFTIDGKRVPINFASQLKGRSQSIVPSDKPATNTYTLNLSDTDAKSVSSTGELKFEMTLKYRDIFKEWHETTVCARYFTEEKIFKYCEYGNDVK